MTVTRTWKVFGAEGHRQRESFCPSYKRDFSDESIGIRTLEVETVIKRELMSTQLYGLQEKQQMNVLKNLKVRFQMVFLKIRQLVKL